MITDGKATAARHAAMAQTNATPGGGVHLYLRACFEPLAAMKLQDCMQKLAATDYTAKNL